MTGLLLRTAGALALAGFLAAPAAAGDWRTLGRDSTRNAVSPEKGLPTDFAFPEMDGAKILKPGKGIAWRADLGHSTVVPPVVADGLVWVCTNAREPADETLPAKDWDGGVLMCFRESDGKLLWKLRTPRLSGPGVAWNEDFSHAALGSVPLVEGDRLWYVNNRSEVECLDIAPLKKGTGAPTAAWKLDMRKALGVFPHLPLMQRGSAAAVAGYKDKLYVVTHNGVDETHANVPAPDAPSLVCLEKATGKVIWKDNSPGKNILENQISSPLVAEVNGQAQVIVGQGDGWLRGFDAATGKLVWKCDLNAKDAVYKLGGGGDRNYVVATPVLYDGRVYVPTGRQAENGPGPGALYCVDPTKAGDVSRELDAGPGKGKPNPNSAVVWHTPKAAPADAPRIAVGAKKIDLLREARGFYFGRSLGSVTAHDGLVYAAELDGYVFCFDAKTGTAYWLDDLKSSPWGQPLWADGKILVATDDGEVIAFAHGKEKKRLWKVEAPASILAGPIFANGTLYLTTQNTLYAVRTPK